MPRPVLLATKFHAPRHRGGVVDRPRLHRRLDLARLPALTLVSAPAGFGKTTLLAAIMGGIRPVQGQRPDAFLVVPGGCGGDPRARRG